MNLDSLPSPPSTARAERGLRELAAATASVVGEKFFESLVRHLAAALQVKWALVTELKDERAERVRSVAAWAGNEYLPTFEYDLAGTPCEQVYDQNLCCYPQGVQHLFPEDLTLRDWGCESYIGVPLRNSQGTTVGILAAMHDQPLQLSEDQTSIFRLFAVRAGAELERLRMDQSIRQSEQRFRALTEGCSDLIMVLDRDGRIGYASSSCERTTGYPLKEILGKAIFDYIVPEDRALALAAFCQAIQRAEPGPLLQCRLRHRNGAIRCFEVRGNGLLDDPYVHGLVVNCRDVTERVEAEDRLKFQKSLLESFNESSLDGILVVSPRQEVLYTNQRFHHLWQTQPSDQPGALSQTLWASLRSRLADPVPSAVDSGGRNLLPDATLRDELRLSDGRTFECYSAPVRDESGHQLGRIWSFRDITERKQLEAQFLRAQRLQCLGEVAGGMAHDLSNILTPIAMTVPTLKRAVSDPEDFERLLTLERCARRGVDLVRQILAFVRGTEGPRTVIAPDHLLREIAALVRQTFPHSIRVQCEAPQGLWPILGNSTQLHQMLLNLAVNARDAMAEGGSLRLSAANYPGENGQGSPTRLPPGRFVVFEVSDTGCGIAPDRLEKCFEPFFTTKQPGAGTGLGLATVRRIVASHSGHLDIQSEPGQGTRFQIHFPVATTV